MTPNMEVDPGTEVLSAEGKIVTAGGIDRHIHATTCTPGAWNIQRMLEAADGPPDQPGLTQHLRWRVLARMKRQETLDALSPNAVGTAWASNASPTPRTPAE